MKKVTILTPTYNRGEELRQLYEALSNQTNQQFEWLIVDDGSVDNTEQIVTELISLGQIPIGYVYQRNGGKHRALNLGIQMIDSELIFIVDSDDRILSNAVDLILTCHRKYKDCEMVCGYSFLRAFPDGSINGTEYTQEEFVGKYIDVRINSGDANSDKAEVFKTHCLKEFAFPEYEGEKFLGEDLVWVRMGRQYSMVYANEVIYVGNYLEGGLTNQRRSHNIQSPRGCMCRAQEFMKRDICIKYRMKATLQYIIYGSFAGEAFYSLWKNRSQTWLFLICGIPGLCLYYKWKRQYEREQKK